MEIFSLIENLEELIESSSKVPFSSKVMVDKEELSSLLEEIKLKLPDELKQAKRIKDERVTILNDAQDEANKILKEAELKIVELVDENAITRQAIEQKEEIIENANRISKEISVSTKEYADNLLERIEDLLSQTLQVVRENRKELK
ncbi:MAG: ATPase [Clostridia bacterium]|nr:ATPase [Clostridia bacterium]